jgi:hypothetical protein
MLPYAGGAIVFLMIVFVVWVGSVPPKMPDIKVDLPQSYPEDDPLLREALNEAEEALRKAKEEENADEVVEVDGTSSGETIEL